MTMTDPIADMLTRVRNANSAHKDAVVHAVLEAQEPHRRDPRGRGLHRRLDRRGRRGGQDPHGRTSSTAPTASAPSPAVRRVSKPGLRVYAKSTNLPKVLGGLGVAIISTSSGLLTDRLAANKGVGGEVLAYIW